MPVKKLPIYAISYKRRVGYGEEGSYLLVGAILELPPETEKAPPGFFIINDKLIQAGKYPNLDKKLIELGKLSSKAAQYRLSEVLSDEPQKIQKKKTRRKRRKEYLDD